MKPWMLRAAQCCLMYVLAGGAHAGTDGYKTGPAPAWVVQVSPLHAPAATPLPPRGGVAYLLQDYQTRADARGKVAYIHSARKALDGGGVEKIANIGIGFDPSYQSMTLHAVNVIRDGKLISKLATAKIHVLQRETELDYLVYDGSMTASILLEDIRIGDIVEYAYSLDGSNPVFQNKLAGKADLEWAVPMEHAFLRLLVPAGRPVLIAPRNSKLKPQLSEADGYRDYRWERRDIPELRVDKGAPEWYDPYASVQWTEFADWAAVARWALPMYQPQRVTAGPLADEIARIGREYQRPAERAAAVLRLVQRDIRYLGIEVGPGSHAPTAPATVFQRRFGDCKDKTLLVVTMLNALGIEAAPALVNTSIGKEVATWAPAPTAFNHVLARVRVDGRLYWLDPTRTLQRGDLEHLYQPDYGYALVIAPDTAGMAPMAAASLAHKDVRAVFDARGAVERPVGYTVETTQQGRQADNLRDQLASNRAELTTQYQNFYARLYASIRADEPLKIRDDERANTLTVVESYRIPGFWEHNAKRKRYEANIEMSEIEAPLKAPDAIGRNAPLYLEYPHSITEVVEVRLPDQWTLKKSRADVHDPAFEFSYEVMPAKDGRSLTITANYRALRDHVEPGDMGNYATHLKQARDIVGYRLYTDGSAPAPMAGWPPAGRPAWLALLLPGLALLLPGCWVLARRRRIFLPQHVEVNQRLVLVAVCVAALAAAVSLPIVPLSNSLPPAAVVLALLGRYLWNTMPMVQATHPAFGLALRCYRLRGDALAVALLALLGRLPALIGCFVLGKLAARLFG